MVYMTYALWIVIVLIALDLLAELIHSFVKSSFSSSTLTGFLEKGIFTYVFPLLVLEYLTHKDPTGWLAATLFYIGALGVVIKYLKDIFTKFSK